MPQITQLDNDPTPNNNDLLVTVDMAAGTTKNISREQFFTGAPLPASTVDLQAINGGTTAGVLTTDASGGVSIKSPKIGVIPASTFATTGNKTVTGIGFKPSIVRFFVRPVSGFSTTAIFAQGVATESSNHATASFVDGTNRRSSPSDSAIFYLLGNGTFQFRAMLASMNSDGFTLNVNLATAGNNVEVVYEAYP